MVVLFAALICVFDVAELANWALAGPSAVAAAEVIEETLTLAVCFVQFSSVQ